MLALTEIMKSIQSKSKNHKPFPKSSNLWESDKNLQKYAKIDNKTRKSLVTLSGGRGGGKSVLLNHAAMHAVQQNWLVIFIPKAERAVKVPFGVKRALDREDVFYQVEYARQFFDYLAKTVRNKLENILLKKVYKSENNEVSAENTDLSFEKADFGDDFVEKRGDFGENDGINHTEKGNIFLEEETENSEKEENDGGEVKELSIEEYERMMENVAEKDEKSTEKEEKSFEKKMAKKWRKTRISKRICLERWQRYLV